MSDKRQRDFRRPSNNKDRRKVTLKTPTLFLVFSTPPPLDGIQSSVPSGAHYPR
jgi:hypothetical protein